ncbi:MAG: winged helix DNA-binding domain-containing protein, partial [Mucilaginibacter sp.]
SLHFLMRAELDGIICSGITREKNQTYALLDERVKKPHPLNEDEALSKLAERYFLSHGPATLHDFVWWSGLSVSDARRSLEGIKDVLIAETIDGQTFWMGSSVTLSESKTTWLLPAFDEFLISYTDRSAAIAIHHQSKAFTTNGIFKPVIVENGNVTGIWKRTIQKDKVVIETELFKAKSNAAISRISKVAKPFGMFLGKKVEIVD